MKTNRLKHSLNKGLKILAWSVMTVALTIFAVLVCTVKILNPERLTPLVSRIANDALNADVHIGRAELAFRPAFPIFEVKVDSLCVISQSLRGIENTESLPLYADSLLSIESMRAGIDLGLLISERTIALTDVEFIRPQINVVLSANGRGNFEIYDSEPDTTTNEVSTTIPPISIHRFEIVEPKGIRYYDAADSTMATIVLLSQTLLDGETTPNYRLDINGKVNTPLLRELINMPELSFGLNGNIIWDSAEPNLVDIEDFRLAASFMQANVDARLRFDTELSVDTAAFAIDPIRLDSLLVFIPDSIKQVYRVTKQNFATDATISAQAHLLRPYVPTRDSIPAVELSVVVPESRLRYGRADLHDLSLKMNVCVPNEDYDQTTVDLQRFSVAGPATSLALSGKFSKLISDPTFDCRLDGDMRLDLLPEQLFQAIEGRLSGRLKINIDAKGSSSMLELGKFHGLVVNGEAVGTQISYLSNDTAQKVEIHHADFRFGSRYRAENAAADAAPTLAASLRVDSANALMSGVGLRLKDLMLGLGIENRGRPADSTMVVPMGGTIRLGNFSVISMADSAGMRLRDLSGRVGLKRYEGNKHMPEITLKAGIERMSAGSPLARVMVRDANLSAQTYLRPDRVQRRKEIARLADSIAVIHPELPQDSLYARALAVHFKGRRPRRNIAETVNNNSEVIDWGMSKGFSRYLNDWYLGGEFTTASAGLYTHFFPLQNRLSHAVMRFNNDSIIVDSVSYKAGRTDLVFDGLVSNIRRSLTGRHHSPLKINFKVISDTLDVNQLAATAFAGAAFSERLRRGEKPASASITDSEEIEEIAIAEPVATSDTLSAILIPTNIDAEFNLEARNILYSDLHMHDFLGDVMIYDGAVNLNGLRAMSDAGNIELSALYSAPRTTEMRAGMGLQLEDFNIERFLKLIPAIDSIMPLMRDFAGTISADIAATVNIDSTMIMELPTLDAAIHLSGQDLAFIDPETYKTIGKWLRFRDRADNRIKDMSVQLLVSENQMQIFPFQFNIDRYTLGVVGSNDLDMNFDYHVSVLKSPLPFKFGVNLKGNPDDYKVRLGRARFKPDMVAERIDMVDTVRVNLIDQIQNVFRNGVSNSRFARLSSETLREAGNIQLEADTLSHEDSLLLIREGLIDAPIDSTAISRPEPNIKK